MGALLPIHIVAAGLGLVLGTVALSAAKGATLHRTSGLAFVYAMSAMCATGVVMAARKGQAVNFIVALLTVYLVVTALSTVRPPSSRWRWFNGGAMLLAVGLGVTMVMFGFEAVADASGQKHGYPPFPLFLFGTVGLLAGAGDMRSIRVGGLRGRPRLARHLWRMCFALWISTASFFGSRTRVASIFPEALQGGAMRALPVLAVLAAMLYWLWRVRSKRPVYFGAVGAAEGGAATATCDSTIRRAW